MSDIFLIIESQQKGPFTEEQVWQDLTEGRIPGDTQAWHEGLPQWVRADEIVCQYGESNAVVPPPASPELPVAPKPEPRTIVSDEARQLPPLPVPLPSPPEPTRVIPEQPPPFPAGKSSGTRQPNSNIQNKTLNFSTEAKILTAIGVGFALLALLIIFLHFVPTSGSTTQQLADSSLNTDTDATTGQTQTVDPKEAIQSVINQVEKIQNGIRPQLPNLNGNSNDDDWNKFAQLLRDEEFEMRKIDLSKCPPDYQDAYNNYISALDDWANIISQHPQVMTDEGMDVVFMMVKMADNASVSDVADPAKDAIDKDSSYNGIFHARHDAVKQAARNIDAIAIKYGVVVNE